MKKTALFYLLSILMLAVACATILKKLKHVSNPGFETAEQVSSYLGKVNGNYSEKLFLCKDSATYFSILLKLQAFPMAVFINSAGAVIRYSEDGCPGKAMDFALKFIPGQEYKIDSSFDWKYLSDKIIPNGQSIFPEPATRQITLVIFWALWAGDINKNVFEIAEALKKRTGLNSQTVFINMDLMKSWGMKKLPEIRAE